MQDVLPALSLSVLELDVSPAKQRCTHFLHPQTSIFMRPLSSLLLTTACLGLDGSPAVGVLDMVVV
jgi:hypothetical protein